MSTDSNFDANRESTDKPIEESTAHPTEATTEQPTKAKKSEQGADFWLYLQLGLCLTLIGIGIYLWWLKRGPEPPTPNKEGLDPAITQVLDECEKVVRQNPRSGPAWGQLGTALLVYDFKPEARICFAHAESFDGTDARWPYFHGVSLLTDQRELALEKLRVAADLNQDDNNPPRLRLASVLAESGNFDEAEKNYRMILEKSKSDPAALLGLGRVMLARGDAAASLEHLNQATESPFTARAAHQLLMAAHHQLGDQAMVSQLQAKLAQLPLDQPLSDPYVEEASKLRRGLKAWMEYANILLQQGNSSDAKKLAQQSIDGYPESAEARMLMSRIHLVEKNAQSAVAEAEAAVKLAPTAAEAHLQLGMTQLFMQQIDAAIGSFQHAAELAPERSEPHHNLGLCHSGKNEWPDAVRCFREAVRLNDKFFESHLGLANAELRAGNPVAARDAIEKARSLSPNDPRVTQFLNQKELQ